PRYRYAVRSTDAVRQRPPGNAPARPRGPTDLQRLRPHERERPQLLRHAGHRELLRRARRTPAWESLPTGSSAVLRWRSTGFGVVRADRLSRRDRKAERRDPAADEGRRYGGTDDRTRRWSSNRIAAWFRMG